MKLTMQLLNLDIEYFNETVPSSITDVGNLRKIKKNILLTHVMYKLEWNRKKFIPFFKRNINTRKTQE